MAIFASTQISWSEPWFFLWRVRERREWLKGLGLALLIAGIVFAAMVFFPNGQGNLLRSALVSLGAGFALVLAMDLPNIQRDVTIHDDCIIVGSTAGRGRFQTFRFDGIAAVRLLRPDDWNQPWSGMILHLGDVDFVVAIPPRVSVETVANILHRLELEVSLSDWTPAESDTRISVQEELQIDPERVTGRMQRTELPEGEPRLLTPVQIAIQVLIALGPLLLALIGGIIASVYLYRNWAATTVLNRCLISAAAVGGVVIAFQYMMRMGQFLAAAFGIRCARGRLRLRSASPFSGEEQELFTVELFDREKWTSVVANSDDFGFMQIDRSRRLLTFEGNKNRWTLPASAISAFRLEESIVGSEGNASPEKRYYVVVKARQDEGDWETGMIYTRTESGADGPEQRHARSQLLFTQLAEILT